MTRGYANKAEINPLRPFRCAKFDHLERKGCTNTWVSRMSEYQIADYFQEDENNRFMQQNHNDIRTSKSCSDESYLLEIY